MKSIRMASSFSFLFTALFFVTGCGQETTQSPKTKFKSALVEISCGQCQFNLPGNGCDLAVRIDGESYFVDGSTIDDHGDAHAEDGLCNCVREGKVTGEIVDGRFVAKSLVVLDAKPNNPSDDNGND